MPFRVALTAGVVEFVSVKVPALTLTVPVVESAKAMLEPLSARTSNSTQLTEAQTDDTMLEYKHENLLNCL